jgi:hypothetical protein
VTAGTHALRFVFVAAIVALSARTLLASLAGDRLHSAIAAVEIAGALLLLPRRTAALGGISLAAICLGVAALHIYAVGQWRFDLVIYAALALYLGFIKSGSAGPQVS